MILEDKVDILRRFYQEKQRMPSYQEMMKLMGYKSKGGVTSFVDRLIEHGVIGKDQGKLYPINLTPQVRILGVISAGFPSVGEELDHEYISLDDWMVRDPKATYMLSIEGDSMVNAGIMPHDYVIVERTNKFAPGDIVVAEIDGQWTLKYLRTKKGKQYLEAANDDYPDMYPQESLTLHAKVIGVTRKYD